MLRVVELFCGIGGLAAALDDRGQVVTAVDVNTKALDVYARNFPHPIRARTIESLRASDFRSWDADLWWLSPPCQPFTRRGLGRDAEDPRARPFLAILKRVAEVRPRYLALENVPGFRGSKVHQLLLGTLERAGYADVQERLICPSELGIPNRRARYYLAASRECLSPGAAQAPAAGPRPLRDFLDPDPDPCLAVDAELVRRYEGALHLVDPRDPAAVTSCFTAAYGRSHVRSGSYLVTEAGVRRFSPREILRLLGFPPSFVLPPDMPHRKAWPLVGNSLSLEPVRVVLSMIPELAGPQGSSSEPRRGEAAEVPDGGRKTDFSESRLRTAVGRRISRNLGSGRRSEDESRSEWAATAVGGRAGGISRALTPSELELPRSLDL